MNDTLSSCVLLSLAQVEIVAIIKTPVLYVSSHHDVNLHGWVGVLRPNFGSRRRQIL